MNWSEVQQTWSIRKVIKHVILSKHYRKAVFTRGFQQKRCNAELFTNTYMYEKSKDILRQISFLAVNNFIRFKQ